MSIIVILRRSCASFVEVTNTASELTMGILCLLFIARDCALFATISTPTGFYIFVSFFSGRHIHNDSVLALCHLISLVALIGM